jgi:hypothetical protein
VHARVDSDWHYLIISSYPSTPLRDCNARGWNEADERQRSLSFPTTRELRLTNLRRAPRYVLGLCCQLGTFLLKATRLYCAITNSRIPRELRTYGLARLAGLALTSSSQPASPGFCRFAPDSPEEPEPSPGKCRPRPVSCRLDLRRLPSTSLTFSAK